MSGIDDIIVHAANSDYALANNEFNAVMQAKLDDMLDQQRISIAKSMVGQTEAEDYDDGNLTITNDDLEDQSEDFDEED
jgi:hypothetical protein